MEEKDEDYERLKDYDFAEAKPASSFPHLVKYRKDLERAKARHATLPDTAPDSEQA